MTLEEKRFVPTELGQIIVDLLKEYFPDIVDVEFTANLEERLDQIEEGEAEWREVLEEFYGPFAEALGKCQKEIEEVEIDDEVTDEVCEAVRAEYGHQVGAVRQVPRLPRLSRVQEHQAALSNEIGVDCPECGRPIVERRSRRGRVVLRLQRLPGVRLHQLAAADRPALPTLRRLMAEMDRRRKGSTSTSASTRRAATGRPRPTTPAANGERRAGRTARRKP